MSLTYRLLAVAVLVLASLLRVDLAAAQRSGQTPAVFDSVGIDARLGQSIPLDLVFRDEAGRAVELATYFDGQRPVLLTLVYHECPMLCSVLLDKVTDTLREMAWQPGAEFEVLTVSFNAIETPALARRQKERYLRLLGKPDAAAGWHFLTGDEVAIDGLTRAVGFSFHWVEAQQEFAHPAALIFLSGDGQIARYYPGLVFPPRDVRAALVEASQGQVGSAIDRLFLTCFRYDPQANTYVPYAFGFMRIGGVLTALALGALLFVLWRREAGKSRRLRRVDLPGQVY